ncbi:MAG: hypothetical protein WD872_11860 [Pirellulaceae bacterium]
MSPTMIVFDRLMDAMITPDMAQQLVRLQADDAIQARVEELGSKCNEGLLTPDEREEYEAYVTANEYIAIVQAKSRALLSHQRA